MAAPARKFRTHHCVSPSRADGGTPVDYDLSEGATLVELTLECVAAEKFLDKRRATVRRALTRMRAAEGRAARKRARRAWRKAKARRDAARAEVQRLC